MPEFDHVSESDQVVERERETMVGPVSSAQGDPILLMGAAIARILSQEPSTGTLGLLLAAGPAITELRDDAEARGDDEEHRLLASALEEWIHLRDRFVSDADEPSFLDATCCAPLSDAAREALDDARADYVRLMVGVGQPLASPWESTYSSAERSIMQRSTLDVRRRYAALGCELNAKHSEPDDHIAYQLEFLCLQLLEEEQGVLANDASGEGRSNARMMPRSAALAEFAAEHFFRFASLWVEAARTNAQTSWYRLLAYLVEATTCSLEKQLLQR